MNATFEVDVPIGALVTCPTIERLADQIDPERAKRANTDGHPLLELQRGDGECPAVFFVPGGIGGDSEFFVYDLPLEIRRRLTRLLQPTLTSACVTGFTFLRAQLRGRTMRERLSYLIDKRRRILEALVARRQPRPRRRVDRAVEYVQRSYSRAIYAYRPTPYPGRATLVVHEEFEGRGGDPTLGWGALVQGGIDVHVLPGDHITHPRTRRRRGQADPRVPGRRRARRRPGAGLTIGAC